MHLKQSVLDPFELYFSLFYINNLKWFSKQVKQNTSKQRSKPEWKTFGQQRTDSLVIYSNMKLF